MKNIYFNMDYSEREEFPEKKDFEYIYQLRHFSNIYGFEYISECLDIPIGRVHSIYYSQIHGSKELKPLLGNDYKKNIIKYKKEEKKRLENIEEAEYKNYLSIKELEEKRKNFSTIGTNKAKRRLNKLIKNDKNIIAEILRTFLEIEDKNILAKKAYGKYKDKIYNQKYKLILKLIEIYKENNFVYGKQKSNNISVSHIVYFELSEGEQISWHCDLEEKNIPEYKKEWDGKINSTLEKIEKITYKLLKKNNLID